MATSELLETKSKTFSMKEFTTYINEDRGTNFDSMGSAIAGLGTGIVSMAIKECMAKTLAGYLGIALSITAIIQEIEKSIDAAKVRQLLEGASDDDRIKVTTSFYAWLSGSGNHTGYYAETTYKIV